MVAKMDDTDHKILRLLQERGRISNVDLSREVGLSPAPTLERVRKLERGRIIEGYHAQVNLGKLGITIKAYIQITLMRQQDMGIHRFIEAVMQVPEIVECYQVTGEFDFVLRVLTPDIEALDKLITNRISKIPDVAGIKSHIILSEIKKSRVVPIFGE